MNGGQKMCHSLSVDWSVDNQRSSAQQERPKWEIGPLIDPFLLLVQQGTDKRQLLSAPSSIDHCTLFISSVSTRVGPRPRSVSTASMQILRLFSASYIITGWHCAHFQAASGSFSSPLMVSLTAHRRPAPPFWHLISWPSCFH